MSDDPISQELARMTGDPALTRALRTSLTRLRDGVGGPDLAEMARDLLDGRTTLREVTRSGVYTEALLRASADARRELDKLSAEELQQLADETQSRLKKSEQESGREAV